MERLTTGITTGIKGTDEILMRLSFLFGCPSCGRIFAQQPQHKPKAAQLSGQLPKAHADGCRGMCVP